MPELPEVEVLVRGLRPLLCGQTVLHVDVHRPRVLGPTTPVELARALTGARFRAVGRRGKYLLFDLEPRDGRSPLRLVGHLGMTGRMYLQPPDEPRPKHAAVTLQLDRARFVFEDTRYFGRFTLDLTPLERLGPEPLEPGFTQRTFADALARSAQPIKVRLLDQRAVAGVGNIYASEALFRARISPRKRARRLSAEEVRRLRAAIREVLSQAVSWGSTVPLDWRGTAGDRLFYYGRSAEAPGTDVERLRVYDRASQPCRRCRTPIRRLIQAGRSTFYCPHCQPG